MDDQMLLQRIASANPGWDIWNQLIALVESLDFDYVESDYMGNFHASGSRLTFAELDDERTWPDWLPAYVPALFGMKAVDWEMAGGYADAFCNQAAEKGSLFSPAGNDVNLGYPLIDVPEGVYDFQSNSSGALFFVNTALEVLYPNSDDECFEVLDPLDEFTRKNIQQALDGNAWFKVYHGLKGSLLD